MPTPLARYCDHRSLEYSIPEREANCLFFLLNRSIELRKMRHVKYVLGGIDSLASYWTSLDASKPWLCYWILHSLDLLGYKIPKELAQR